MSDRHIVPVFCEHFQAIKDGRVTFQVCKDLGYSTGDLVRLQEFDICKGWIGEYTDREILAEITSVSRYEQKKGWCVVGFEIIYQKEAA